MGGAMPPQNDDILLSAIAEVKGEMVKIGIILEQVLRQATLTNGRVSRLEEWRQSVLLADAHDRGVIEGTSATALSKPQVRMIAAGIGVITTVSGTIVGVIMKVAGCPPRCSSSTRGRTAWSRRCRSCTARGK